MRTTTFSVCLLIGLGCVAAGGWAHAARVDPAERFAQADADHDGRVTRDEFMAARAARFAKVDRDGDGFLGDADLPRFVRSNPGMLQKVHALQQPSDADGDGRISRDEFEQAGATLFARADANHDGCVDAGEMDRAAAQARALADRRGD